MYQLTTCSSIDWVWTEIEVQDDRVDQLSAVYDTPEQYDFFQQGINEGWITIIGPVQ
jgi:hypothetical protein